MGWGPFGAPGWGYDMVSPLANARLWLAHQAMWFAKDIIYFASFYLYLGIFSGILAPQMTRTTAA